MTTLHHAVEAFGNSLKQSGKQPATIHSYQSDAKQFVDYLARHNLAVGQLEGTVLKHYTDFLQQQGEKHNSIRRNIIGIRQFFRFLQDENEISTSPFETTIIPNRIEKLPTQLTKVKVAEIISCARACSPEWRAVRNECLVKLLAYEGIKASELTRLKWNSVVFVKDNASLRIHGSRSRTIQLEASTGHTLKEYRNLFKELHKKVVPTAAVFFAAKGRGASLKLADMTRHGLKFVIYEVGEKVGIERLNTELLRHFAIQHKLDGGKSIHEIMYHLGLKRPGLIRKHICNG